MTRLWLCNQAYIVLGVVLSQILLEGTKAGWLHVNRNKSLQNNADDWAQDGWHRRRALKTSSMFCPQTATGRQRKKDVNPTWITLNSICSEHHKQLSLKTNPYFYPLLRISAADLLRPRRRHSLSTCNPAIAAWHFSGNISWWRHQWTTPVYCVLK